MQTFAIIIFIWCCCWFTRRAGGLGCCLNGLVRFSRCSQFPKLNRMNCVLRNGYFRWNATDICARSTHSIYELWRRQPLSNTPFFRPQQQKPFIWFQCANLRQQNTRNLISKLNGLGAFDAMQIQVTHSTAFERADERYKMNICTPIYTLHLFVVCDRNFLHRFLIYGFSKFWILKRHCMCSHSLHGGSTCFTLLCDYTCVRLLSCDFFN